MKKYKNIKKSKKNPENNPNKSVTGSSMKL